MAAFLRFAGWAVLAAWILVFAAALARADFYPFANGRHLGAGLSVLLAALLVQSLPYFAMIGAVARERAAKAGDGIGAGRLNALLSLKSGLFLPTALAVVATLLLPVAGLLEAGGRIPGGIHLAISAAAAFLHIRCWAKSLFALDLARELAGIDADTSSGDADTRTKGID